MADQKSGNSAIPMPAAMMPSASRAAVVLALVQERADNVQDQLVAVMHVELDEQPPQVAADRRNADLQCPGDLLVREALEDAPHHVVLTRRKLEASRQLVPLRLGKDVPFRYCHLLDVFPLQNSLPAGPME